MTVGVPIFSLRPDRIVHLDRDLLLIATASALLDTAVVAACESAVVSLLVQKYLLYWYKWALLEFLLGTQYKIYSITRTEVQTLTREEPLQSARLGILRASAPAQSPAPRGATPLTLPSGSRLIHKSILQLELLSAGLGQLCTLIETLQP